MRKQGLLTFSTINCIASFSTVGNESDHLSCKLLRSKYLVYSVPGSTLSRIGRSSAIIATPRVYRRTSFNSIHSCCDHHTHKAVVEVAAGNTRWRSTSSSSSAFQRRGKNSRNIFVVIRDARLEALKTTGSFYVRHERKTRDRGVRGRR